MLTDPHSDADLILVVDDDPDIVRFVEMNLRLHGFAVLAAHGGAEALEKLGTRRPALALVDLMMPGMDGVELTRRMRADSMLTTIPIVLLTARGLTSDKVAGLRAGADDYIVKPFDTAELVARVQAILRRDQAAREASPLTGLAGNVRIQQAIAARLQAGVDFAVCYVDIDRFKAVNDVYGFGRGDLFIQALAHCMRSATESAGDPPAFLGHVGGDDFVVVCHPDQVRHITTTSVHEFEATADRLYDPADAARGYLEITDRHGMVHQVNLVTLSIGVAVSTWRTFRAPQEVVVAASEMKTVAKKHRGSYVAFDRRGTRPVAAPASVPPQPGAAAGPATGAPRHDADHVTVLPEPRASGAGPALLQQRRGEPVPAPAVADPAQEAPSAGAAVT